jgi:hypothetical protein
MRATLDAIKSRRDTDGDKVVALPNPLSSRVN